VNSATGPGRRREGRPARSRQAAIVLGSTVSVALNWPGQLSYDSVAQLMMPHRALQRLAPSGHGVDAGSR